MPACQACDEVAGAHSGCRLSYVDSGWSRPLLHNALCSVGRVNAAAAQQLVLTPAAVARLQGTAPAPETPFAEAAPEPPREVPRMNLNVGVLHFTPGMQVRGWHAAPQQL